MFYSLLEDQDSLVSCFLLGGCINSFDLLFESKSVINLELDWKSLFKSGKSIQIHLI